MSSYGGPAAAVQLDQTLAQSALAEVPRLAKAAKESHYTIESEMMAWENDQDSSHLLHVIAMLQHQLAAHTSALMTFTAEGYATQAALRQVAAAGGSEDGPGRRGPVMAAMDQLGAGLSTASQPLRHAADPPPLIAVEMQTLLRRQQELFEQIDDWTKLAHDADLASR